jgi:signal transduction histidine kinase
VRRALTVLVALTGVACVTWVARAFVADHPSTGAVVLSGIVAIAVVGIGWIAQRQLDGPQSRWFPVATWVAGCGVVVSAVVGDGWDAPSNSASPLLVVASAVTIGTTAARQIATFVTLPIALVHLVVGGGSTGDRVLVAAAWTVAIAALLVVTEVAVTIAERSERRRQATSRRVDLVTETNTLLAALREATRHLPSSLDLDDVVDTTLGRIGSLVPHDTIALYLRGDDATPFDLVRSTGHRVPRSIEGHATFGAVRSALDERRTVRSGHLDVGQGLSGESRSALVTALRSGDGVIGLLVIESDTVDAHTIAHAEIVHGLAEPFGTAIENGRLFRQLRSSTVSEERRRIARDLHDQVGSSLALVGFEVDRARQLAARGEPVGEVLDGLRVHVTSVVSEIRETLHDLRTDVDDGNDLTAVLRRHLERVGSRRSMRATLTGAATVRPPRQIERELWQIALEAITNVERHARASSITVEYSSSPATVRLVVADDGIGLNTASTRADAYGMVGMRERAHAIGATLRIDGTPGAGTTVEVTWHVPGVEP